MSSSNAARCAVVALVILLAGCSPATPSPAPPSPVTPAPSPSAPPASTVPTAPPSAAPSPSPAGDGWTAVAVAPQPEIGAALTAVAGSSSAMDATSGFRLRATAGVPLASLLERLRVEPALAYRVEPAADGGSAILRPKAALQAGSQYRFTLVDGAGAPLTGWAFQVAGPPRVVGTSPGNESTDVPVTTGIEFTFDQDGVVVEGSDVVVRLLPDGTALAGAVEMHGRAAVFVPARRLLEGRAYQATVRAGTGAGSGHGGLSGDVTFTFLTGRTATVGSIEAELEQGFSTSLPGEHALLVVRQWRNQPDGNQEELTTPVGIRIYRLPDEAAAIRVIERFLRTPSWAGAGARPTISTSGLTRVFAGSASFVRASGDARLRLPIAGQAGWYLVELREARVSQAVLQVTDILGMAGVREDRFVAWVNDARAGAAVAGAPIEIVGGSRLGRTDARGVLIAPTPASLLSARGSILVRMTADAGRRVIVELASDGGPYASGSWDERRNSGLATWWSALSTDRWLYRPTDTIQAWGYLRTRADERPASSIRLRVWRDSDGPPVGRPIATVDAQQAATGAWIGSVQLRDLPYGWYLLEVVADGRRVEAVGFEVGEVRKPPYQLELAAAPRALVAGNPLTATVTARFFEGTPAAGIPVAVRLESSDQDPAGHAVTDVAGVATVALRPDPFVDDNGQYACAPIVASPDTAVEASAQGSQDICIFRGLEFVDLEAVRDGGVVAITGAVHGVDLAAVEGWLRSADRDSRELDPRGAAVGGRRVEVLVTETVLRRVVVGRWYDPITRQVVESYDWEDGSSTTTSRVVTTRADGTYRLRVPAAAHDRSWKVEAVIADEAGHRITEWRWVEDRVAAREAPSYGLGFPGDSNEFAVGETVTAAITGWKGDREVAMPVGGANRYLFLVTGPTRFDALVGPAARASVRFRAGDEPNLGFDAVWFTGRDYLVLGTATANLRTADRRITVTLTADRDRYAPGDSATVTVRTVDGAGRPVPASVLLRGIDEKLLAMGVAAFSDPLDLIYRRLPVGLLRGPVVSHTPWRPGDGGGKGSTTGGGGGDRSDFRDALPTQMVTTTADGRATISLQLPDDITGWRIAATAITATRLAGSTTILLPVGLPFFADATIAPEYLAGDRVSIRVRAFGSALPAGAPVRFTVASSTLGMPPTTVEGTAFAEVLVPLPALTPGTHEVTIAAASAAGSDRLVRTFQVVESRLAAGHRETVPIAGSTAPPGGPGLTRLVLADAGRARYLELLLGLAMPRGQRADERLAGSIARSLLVEHFGVDADSLPDAIPFARSSFQAAEGGLSLLPYASADLELTVRALVADPGALFPDSARPWLRAIADERGSTIERRTVALVGLAALGEPVLGSLQAALDDRTADGRTQLWAALGLAILGDRGAASAAERSLVERWGERRGDQVRLRISGAAEDVSEATELLALLAAWLDDPLAAEALAYLVAVPPLDDLAVLAQVSVVSRLVERLPAAPAVVAIVEGGERSTVEIPGGGAVTMEVLADRRTAMRLEPVSGAVAVTASWDEPTVSAADLGLPDGDLALTRTISPASPIAPNSVVSVSLDLRVEGPGRNGTVEVVDIVPSGLAALDGGQSGRTGCGAYDVGPARVEGQRVLFVVSFQDVARNENGESYVVIPGTFCLGYLARVVTAGTYVWQPAVARQATSPGLVATTPAATVELR